MNSLDALQQLRLPDAWQAEAIRALAAGDDVIVQAPTGAGKTFIFEQFYQQRRGPGPTINSRNGRGRAGASASPPATSPTIPRPR
jgi:hypothetical protein